MNVDFIPELALLTLFLGGTGIPGNTVLVQGLSWLTASPPDSARQDPLLPGQLAAARHRDRHHRLVPPDPGCAKQRLGPGPAGRAAPPAPSRV